MNKGETESYRTNKTQKRHEEKGKENQKDALKNKKWIELRELTKEEIACKAMKQKI